MVPDLLPSIPPAALKQPAPGTVFLPSAPRINALQSLGTDFALLAGNGVIYNAATTLKYLIFINGVLRNSNHSLGRDSLNISSSLGNWPTASFTVISTDGTYRPVIEQEVIVIDAATGVRLFAGDIENPGEEHEDGTSIIWTQVKAVGYANRLDRIAFQAYYDTVIAWNTNSIINDILVVHAASAGIRYAGGALGSSFTAPLALTWDLTSSQIRKILDRDGLDFIVDAYRQLWIVSKTAGYEAAPFNLTDSTNNWDSNTMSVRPERARYANRVILIPDWREPGFWTDTWLGNQGPGATVGFYLTTYILNDKPRVLVNGTVMRVGEYWASRATVDFTYVPGGHGVNSVATYGGGDTIEIQYPIPLQPAIIAEDTAEQTSYGRIVDAIIQVRDVTDRPQLVTLAAGELARRKVRPYVVEYTTRVNGLRPGQVQNINTTQPLVPNIDVLIDSVNGTFEPTASGGHFRWAITASNSQVQGEQSSVRTKQRIRAALLPPQDRHRTPIIVDLAMDPYPGFVGNEGLIRTGQVPGVRNLDKPAYLKEVRLTFQRTATQLVTAQIDVRINGTTIFANSQYIEYPSTQASLTTVVKYDFASSPYITADGDVLTVWVITGDAALKNGKCEIEIQG
jgi:hypothetical protein